MTPPEFVKLIHFLVDNSARSGAKELLKHPPGRNPGDTILNISQWYIKLLEQDRANVDAVIDIASNLSTYKFLALLDGLARIDEGEIPGRLKLYYERDGIEHLLNDENDEFLSSLIKDYGIPPI